MATISSIGIGSGLDVKSIVSQMVAIEKQPLDKLKVAAATFNTKISAYGEIKALFSKLSDTASTLGSLTTWSAVSASSSDSTAVTASAVGGTASANFSVEVIGLAKAQTTASQALAGSTKPGAGKLIIESGTWSALGGTFVAAVPAVNIPVTVTSDDSLSSIASKINEAAGGVGATVMTDPATGDQRLLLRATATGAAAGFRMSVAEDGGVTTGATLTDNTGLSRLVYEATAGDTVTQLATNATAKLNGLSVSSATNTFANVVSGVSFTALKETTSAVEVKVVKDQGRITAGVEAFVDAYNTINSTLSEATKSDTATKSVGLLQGDSGAIGLMNAMRGMLQSVTSGGSFTRLADIGVTALRGGNLSIDSTKLNAALNDKFEDLKNLFKADTSNDLTDGVAVKFKKFSNGLLATDGFFGSKEASLKRFLSQNASNQTSVSERVSRYETQLNARYSSLDAKMASLTALNSYISQQVTMWNKNTA